MLDNLTPLIHSKGIYKERRSFFAVEIMDVVAEDENIFLQLSVLGSSYAIIKNNEMIFEKIISSSPKFQFGGNINYLTLQKEQNFVLFQVMYVGELVIHVPIFEKFIAQDPDFWSSLA